MSSNHVMLFRFIFDSEYDFQKWLGYQKKVLPERIVNALEHNLSDKYVDYGVSTILLPDEMAVVMTCNSGKLIEFLEKQEQEELASQKRNLKEAAEILKAGVRELQADRAAFEAERVSVT